MTRPTRHRRARRHLKSAQRSSSGARQRPLRFESLEDRRLLTITVDTLTDELDGSIVDGDISLRDALAAAAPMETVQFDPALTSGGPATITLTLGQLIVTRSMTILGPGADLLSIDAAGGGRVMSIDDGNDAILQNVGIIGLTLTGGVTTGFLYGGGIRNRENLTITASTIAGNAASFLGGGIWSGAGALTIFDSTISGNSASHGGGIFAGAEPGGQTAMYSSTISGNTATVSGGGLFNMYGNASLRHATITNNSAPNGGGVASYGSSLTETELYSSIIAGNSNRDADIFGDVRNISLRSLGFNIVGDGNALAAFTSKDIVGVADPRLEPLTDNGGPTFTHAVQPDSPAFNAGDPNFEPPPDTDQRGPGFPRVRFGRIDIGAYEAVIEIDAKLVVDTLADEVNGDFTSGDFSLREAIELANLEADAQTISFSAALTSDGPATISLALGELSIINPVTIDGPGADLMTLAASPGSRIFRVDDGPNGSQLPIDVVIDGLTLTGGTAAGSTNGGAVFNRENLTVTNAVISGNSATLRGGGVYSRDGSLTVIDSTISGNMASQSGGGIESRYANLAITNSTIDNNSAGQYGGGLLSVVPQIGQSATVTSSTVSGNTAGVGGGGIFNLLGYMEIRHSTITANSAPAGGGSGVASYSLGGLTRVHSSIIAGNTASDIDLVGPSGGSPVESLGFNIVGGGDAAGSFNQPGDRAGVNDPRLGPLADNGGPTRTHALLITSPAINSGDPSAVAGMDGVPESDQRGVGRVQHGRIDIGSYEALFSVGESLVVDTLVDELDGDFATGDFSLREALWLANLDPDSHTITFAESLTSGGPAMLTVTMGELDVTNPVTIDGPGAKLLTLNAAGQSRIFHIDDGSEGLIDVSIGRLTLSGGNVGSVGDGGAIRSQENLTVTESIVTGNSALGGAGIYSRDGQLTIRRSTVSDNKASLYGGGIHNRDGNLTVVDSTFSGNTAGGAGGIFNHNDFESQTTTISNSTISGNTATSRGGGLLNSQGRTVIRYSTITNNTAPASGGGGAASYGNSTTQTNIRSSIIAGNAGSDVLFVAGGTNSFVSQGYNIIGTGNGEGAFEQTGDRRNVINPGLAPLADNGGPTRTHALLLSSVAINGGDPTALPGTDGVPAFDQRGDGFARIADGIVDVGAFEHQNPELIVDTLIDESDGNFSPGDLSLREAIEIANLRNGAQTITMDDALINAGPVTIKLALGQILISDSLTLIGLGAEHLTINGNGLGRIFFVNDGATGQYVDVTIRGLTFAGGNVAGMSNGGAISNLENLTVAECTITGNAALGGGGIYSRDGHLTVTHCTVSDNSATLYGGGIRVRNGSATITDSTITGNMAGAAGGIFSEGVLGQTTTILNSTISGNSVSLGDGGGILNAHGILEIRHSTITANTSHNGAGGGVASYGAGAETNVYSSIIAGNAGDDVAVDGLGGGAFISAGYNLVGIGNGAASFNQAGDRAGVTNPLLGPLADNGGPTLTHSLLVGSPAVNGGDPNAVPGTDGVPASDQRGMPRIQHGRIDIGAFEALFTVEESLVVDTLVDEIDGNRSAGDFALREALWLANLDADAHTIAFAEGLTSGGPATIMLSLGELSISNPVVVEGPGAELLTIHAGGQNRVLHIDDNSAGLSDVAISGLTLTGGNVVGFQQGGGILNRENLTVTASMITGNNSSFVGGGIWSGAGDVNIVDSTIAGNTATHGGGIFSGANGSAASITIANSTISGNSATISGGGLLVMQGMATIRHSTITQNTAPAGAGSGVASYGTSSVQTIVHSTIIAGNKNSDVDQFGGNGSLSFQSNGYNLVGAGNALAAFTNNDLVGVQPRLAPLADHGGPTRTHALAAGSPAFDAGDPAAIAGMDGLPEFDQRGEGFPRVFNGRIDIGAFESQVIVPALAGDYNEDGQVDAADYIAWRFASGSVVPPFTGADGDGNGVIDQADYQVWRANFGSTLPVAVATSAVLLSEPQAGSTRRQADSEESRAEAGVVNSLEAASFTPGASRAVGGLHPLFDAAAPIRPPQSGRLGVENLAAVPGRGNMLLTTLHSNRSDAEDVAPLETFHTGSRDLTCTGEGPDVAAVDLAFERLGAALPIRINRL